VFLVRLNFCIVTLGVIQDICLQRFLPVYVSTRWLAATCCLRLQSASDTTPHLRMLTEQAVLSAVLLC
jgi:hypothetical protein